ncbi:putative NRPS-like enzyme [Aspergillus flavus AF70]|nr:putative NRPS-like enzyme [Aspergillus flavus AF70]
MGAQTSLLTPPNLTTHSQSNHAVIPVVSQTQRVLQQAWIDTLQLSDDKFGLEANFLSLGGDSIAAINLVSYLRYKHLKISVRDVLKYPVLGTMAGQLKRESDNTQQIKQKTFVSPPEVDAAISTTSLQPTEWYGVVLRDGTPMVEIYDNVNNNEQRNQIIKSLDQHRFVFGQPFIRYAILHLSTGKTEIVTKLDRGLYDGTLLRIFGEHFEAYQRNSALERFTSFKVFAFHIWQMDKSRTLSFWKQSAKRPITFGFPSASIKEPRINSVYVHTINLEFDAFAKSTGATVSIIFQSIFQLWLALRSNQRDVAFDYLYTDRNVDLVDLQTINSIYTNFLPMRSTVNALIPVSEFLHQTQDKFW